MVRILPFGRNVLVTSHRAQATDFEEIKWLIQFGSTETCYDKPSNALIKRMRNAASSGSEPDELPPCTSRAIENQISKVWASDALSTPLDDDIQGCLADHPPPSSWSKICHPCGEARSKALQATDLTYHLVFHTTETFGLGSSSPGGKQVYKLVKCGSREAAVAEVFHACGMNGWNLAFSCVTRASADPGEKGGKFKRVRSLWMLADGDADDNDLVRVFY